MSHTARVIKHSVGRNGLNRAPDVAVIQQLLNGVIAREEKLRSAGIAQLDITKTCDASTIGAIEKFQEIVLHWSGRAVDGTVEPNKGTWKALNGNIASTPKIKRLATPRPMWVGSYAAFRQGDFKEKLGESSKATIARYGCALCSLTMAATYIGSPTKFWPEGLAPRDLSPLGSNEIFRKAGAFSGYQLIMKKAAESLGMEYDEYTGCLTPDDISLIDEHMRRGYPVAANVDYKNKPDEKKSKGDHWVLVITRHSDGTFNAIDPATGLEMLLTRGDRMTVYNLRYQQIKDEGGGVLFGWVGSGGSHSQEKYVVVRFALLAPAGESFLCE
jgi:hypothetical protein